MTIPSNLNYGLSEMLGGHHRCEKNREMSRLQNMETYERTTLDIQKENS